VRRRQLVRSGGTLAAMWLAGCSLQPTKIDFIVNLQAARALGVTTPQFVLTQETEIIQ